MGRIQLTVASYQLAGALEWTKNEVAEPLCGVRPAFGGTHSFSVRGKGSDTSGKLYYKKGSFLNNVENFYKLLIEREK